MSNSYNKVIFTLCWLTLAGFTAVFLLRGNFEFILYAVTLTVLIALVQWSARHYRYNSGILLTFWLWLVLHMCGGFLHFGGVRLYDIQLLPLVDEPYYILRYDQFVHAFCYVALGGLLKTVIAASLGERRSTFVVALLTFLAAMGLGAVNEVIEFAAVAWLGAAEGVGDYYNNALDLVFNALGAIMALGWRLPAT